MKVLYIHQYFATRRGGTGTRSYEFARRLAAAGHEVTLLTSTAQLGDELPKPVPRRYAFDCNGIRVIALEVSYRQQMGILRRLRSFLAFAVRSTWAAVRLPRQDLVYATSTPLTVALPALAVRFLRGTPFVFEVRDLWPAVPIGIGVLRNPLLIAALRWFERFTYRRSAGVVALSPPMADEIRPHVSPGHRVEVIPNAADRDFFSPTVSSTIRADRGWNDKIICVHTGAMGRINGLMSIIKLAERTREDPRVIYWLIGRGAERDSLEAEVARLGLDNVVIEDTLPKERMPAVLAAADIGLMIVAPYPVLEMNCANKFFDYLSAGKPVLLNYSGWMRDCVEAAEAGLGAPQGDADGFHRNLTALIEDATLRKKMGSRARELATRFDRDFLFEGLEKLLLGVVVPRPTPT